MISYSKLRKLNVEVADARDTGDLDARITADDSVAYTDLTSTPTQLKQFYYQATGPSHSAASCVASTVESGDYWIDSDTNKLYISDGSSWGEIQDNDIAQAISDAAGAQGTADGKVVTFYQTGVPTALGGGDLWIDTDDGNKLYRATAAGDDQIGGGEWIEVQDNAIATAIANAATAQSTADGKIVSFYQDAVPTATDVGDFWYDTNDGNKLYRSTAAGDDQIGGGEWIEISPSLDNVTDGTSYNRVGATYVTGGRVLIVGDSGNQIALNASTGVISVKTATYGNDGIQLDYNSGNPRFYCGDGSEEYFKFDGTNVSFSTAKSGGGIFVRQGGDIVMEGGATGNPSLLRFTDSTVPGEIRFEESADDTNYVKFYKDGTYFLIEPSGIASPKLRIGNSDADTAFETIAIRGETSIVFYLDTNTRSLGLYSSGVQCFDHLFPDLDSTYTLGKVASCWSNIYGDAGVTSCSDIKYKTNINQTPLGIDFINSLAPVSFEWRKDGKRPKIHDGVYHGLIAPEVEQALIDIGKTTADFGGIEISMDEDNEPWYGLKYEQFIAPMIKAIQQLDAKIESIKNERTTNPI